MAKKKRKPNRKMQAWIEARKRHHLTHARIQMARELGMNPKKLGSLDNRDQQPWKMPLRQYIEHLNFKRFDEEWPDIILSIEDKMCRDEEKKVQKREAKLRQRQNETAEQEEPEASHP